MKGYWNCVSILYDMKTTLARDNERIKRGEEPNAPRFYMLRVEELRHFAPASLQDTIDGLERVVSKPGPEGKHTLTYNPRCAYAVEETVEALQQYKKLRLSMRVVTEQTVPRNIPDSVSRRSLSR